MRPKLKLTAEQMAEIKSAKAKNRDKQIDKRLTVLELVGEGMERAEIARITGFSVSYVPKLAAAYRKSGIGAKSSLAANIPRGLMTQQLKRQKN